jgi:hypothetical protein
MGVNSMKDNRSEAVKAICKANVDDGCRTICPLSEACKTLRGDTKEIFDKRLNDAANHQETKDMEQNEMKTLTANHLNAFKAKLAELNTINPCDFFEEKIRAEYDAGRESGMNGRNAYDAAVATFKDAVQSNKDELERNTSALVLAIDEAERQIAVSVSLGLIGEAP